MALRVSVLFAQKGGGGKLGTKEWHRHGSEGSSVTVQVRKKGASRRRPKCLAFESLPGAGFNWISIGF